MKPRQAERARVERLLRPLREQVLDLLLLRAPQAIARDGLPDDRREHRLYDVQLGDAPVLGPVCGVEGQPCGGDEVRVCLREGSQGALGLLLALLVRRRFSGGAGAYRQGPRREVGRGLVLHGDAEEAAPAQAVGVDPLALVDDLDRRRVLGRVHERAEEDGRVDALAAAEAW